MVHLKSLSDTQLLEETHRLAQEERRIGIEVIHHLAEIYARRLFAARGYPSLFEYVVRELGYSGGSAHRRISAMHLIREVPEYEEKLKQGVVTVSTLSQVGSFLFQEKRQKNETYSKDEKLELLSRVEGKSSRETTQILSGISPESARPERTRVLSPEETEIRFTADQELMKKLERLKELLAHHPQARSGIAGLIGELADIALKKVDPLCKTQGKVENPGKENTRNAALVPSAKKPQSTAPEPNIVHSKGRETDSVQALARLPATQRSRTVPASVRRAVWLRDRGECQYRDPKTGRRCLSRHAIQIDHRIPFAKGGASDVGNCRLLCSIHNEFLAIREYGPEKMKSYRPSMG